MIHIVSSSCVPLPPGVKKEFYVTSQKLSNQNTKLCRCGFGSYQTGKRRGKITQGTKPCSSSYVLIILKEQHDLHSTAFRNSFNTDLTRQKTCSNKFSATNTNNSKRKLRAVTRQLQYCVCVPVLPSQVCCSLVCHRPNTKRTSRKCCSNSF